jgi:hypothetical protein
MEKNISIKITVAVSVFLYFFIGQVNGQSKKQERKKEFYFSWGYNKEWYTNSTVKINQPSLNNRYSFINIQGHDHPGWDEGIFNRAFTIPQYNYRIGLFINKKKGLAVEINFDHTKFIFADQQASIKGVLNNRNVDTIVNFNRQNGYYYYLNNGANFLLFNIVKRWHWMATKNENIQIDLLGKAGIGPVIPHVENSFFGNKNKDGFQLGGWNVGVEAALRATFYKYVFLEYCNKLDYARYSNLKVYEGTAKHAFGIYEMILNLGFTFPVGGKEK